MIIGYFDFIVIGTLIFLNIKFWKNKFDQFDLKVGFISSVILFGLILPFFSIIIELEIIKSFKGEWMDNFEVMYTIFRFPIYWIIGIVQIIIIGIKFKKLKTDWLN